MAAYDIEEELEYPDTFILPELFVLDKLGKERVWRVWSRGDRVVRIQGLVTGKKLVATRTFTAKNVGKKNETSGEEQARREAEKMWAKQLDKQYLPKCEEGLEMVARIQQSISESGGKTLNVTASIRGRATKNVKTIETLAPKKVLVPIKPMKAQVWSEEDKVLKYFNFDEGFTLQRKFDGIRCVARLQPSLDGGEDEVVMTTNNLKQFPWFKSLRAALLKFLKGKEYLDGLDGELYVHRIVDEDGKEVPQSARFNLIQTMCKINMSKPHPLEDQIRFYVFDLVDLSGKRDQLERLELLRKLFRANYGAKNLSHFDRFQYSEEDTYKVKLCDHITASSIEEIEEYHDEVAQEGFEGVMIRANELRYATGKKSLQMRKYKKFSDKEYYVIDAVVDSGVGEEHFVWVCIDPDIIDKKTQQPIRFQVKQRDVSEAERRKLYRNKNKYIGKMLTVSFQEKSADGVPRFPIGIGFRDDQ